MPLHLTQSDIGKQFVRRDGRVEKLARYAGGALFPFISERFYSYRADGRYLSSDITGIDLIHPLGADMEPQVVCRDERKAAPRTVPLKDVPRHSLFEFNEKIYRMNSDCSFYEIVSDVPQPVVSCALTAKYVTLRPDLQLELVLKNK